MWSFFLSTNSALTKVAPATTDDLSTRTQERRYTRVTPFFSFPVNVGMSQCLKENTSNQLTKPLCQFATIEHMALFGRPLGKAYTMEACSTVRDIVLKKVFNQQFDTSNVHHIFALMSYRVCTQPCMNNKGVAALCEQGVNSHLRVILEMDSENGLVATTTPSEPEVCEALAYLLNSTGGNMGMWSSSLQTLVNKLLSPGLVDRGRTGELAMRVLLILARDRLLAKSKSNYPYSFSLPFTLPSFLEALFGKHISEGILSAGARPGAQATAQQVFKSSCLNFTHFLATETHPSAETMSDLLHGLMLQQAALQMKFNGQDWDLLIPVYLGDPEAPFDRSQLTAFLIQVKNRITTKPWVVPEGKYTKLFPKVPILAIIVEWGAGKADCQQLQSTYNEIFIFRVTGHGQETYDLLRENSLELSMKQLLGVNHDTAAGLQKSISAQVDVFKHSHRWQDCYPGFSLKPAVDENKVVGAQQKTKDKPATKGVEASPVQKKALKGSRKRKAKGEQTQMVKADAEKKGDTERGVNHPKGGGKKRQRVSLE